MLALLPLNLENLVDAEPETSYRADMVYEPSPEAVFNSMVEQYLVGMVYASLVQSYASEQSARMRAMDSSTQNATKMIASLQQEYRRARQAAITNEIIEIVSGTNAVRKKKKQ
jgi:F-type H+-transporting ATPase subunit gamma